MIEDIILLINYAIEEFFSFLEENKNIGCIFYKKQKNNYLINA